MTNQGPVRRDRPGEVETADGPAGQRKRSCESQKVKREEESPELSGALNQGNECRTTHHKCSDEYMWVHIRMCLYLQ